jgi:XapX domain-containing protein
MNSYLISLLMGLTVGVVYGLVHVRSHAPPMIALVGLLGMLLGKQAVDLVRYQVAPSSKSWMQRPSDNGRRLADSAVERRPPSR